MSKLKILVALVAAAAFSWVCISSLYATAKIGKDEGIKKCTHCHNKIPKKGAEDPDLNDVGKTFKGK